MIHLKFKALPNTVVFIFIFIVCKTIYAQNGEQSLGTWYVYNGTHTLSEKLDWYTELQYNTYDAFSNLEQAWFITSLDYKLKQKTKVSLGYGVFYSDPSFEDKPTSENFWENRIFEQISFGHTYGKLKLQHRYRLENRIFEAKVNRPVIHRFRYRLKLKYPISEKWFVQVFNELFLDFRDEIFNQNRAYGAVGYNFTNKINLQVGYMKIHFTGRSYDRLQLVLTINSDLRKKNQQNQ